MTLGALLLVAVAAIVVLKILKGLVKLLVMVFLAILLASVWLAYTHAHP